MQNNKNYKNFIYFYLSRTRADLRVRTRARAVPRSINPQKIPIGVYARGRNLKVSQRFQSKLCLRGTGLRPQPRNIRGCVPVFFIVFYNP